MHRTKLLELSLPPPPPCPTWCLNDVTTIVEHLVKKHGAKPWQVKFIIGCLNESFLLSLPRFQKDTHDYNDTSPQRLRWLFYSWIAHILGWTKRREEGDEDGLSPEVYQLIREVVFPFPKVERPEVVSLTPPAHASTATACTGTSSLTKQSEHTFVRDKWTQHFLYEGDIDKDGFIVEAKFANRSICIQERLLELFDHKPDSTECTAPKLQTSDDHMALKSTSTHPHISISHGKDLSSAKRKLPAWMLKSTLATLSPCKESSVSAATHLPKKTKKRCNSSPPQADF